MYRGYKFSPSLMCMDLMKIKEQINFFNKNADALHIDIMDGHFVKNITLSPFFIEQIRSIATIQLDAHMMVTNPGDFVQMCINAGTDLYSPHIEVSKGDMFRMYQTLLDHEKQIGVTLNPATSVVDLEHVYSIVSKVTVMTVDPGFAGQKYVSQMLHKIEQLKEIKIRKKFNFEIEIDGSCNKNTFKDLSSAGAEVFVVGTSGLFSKSEHISDAWRIMLDEFDSVVSR